MNHKKESDIHRSKRRAFQVEGVSLVHHETERKISLMGREGQIRQGFVNQEKEYVYYYSKEALSRAMRSHSSQKAAEAHS